VRARLGGALSIGSLGRFNRSQHFGLVEQHRLIRVDRGGIYLLGRDAEVLRLHLAQFFLQQRHALDVVSPFGLQLLNFLVKRLERGLAFSRETLGQL